MRDMNDENRTASYGEVFYIQNLGDEELDEFIEETEKAIEEQETMLMNDYLNIAMFEKEIREERKNGYYDDDKH